MVWNMAFNSDSRCSASTAPRSSSPSCSRKDSGVSLRAALCAAIHPKGRDYDVLVSRAVTQRLDSASLEDLSSSVHDDEHWVRVDRFHARARMRKDVTKYGVSWDCFKADVERAREEQEKSQYTLLPTVYEGAPSREVNEEAVNKNGKRVFENVDVDTDEEERLRAEEMKRMQERHVMKLRALSAIRERNMRK